MIVTHIMIINIIMATTIEVMVIIITIIKTTYIHVSVARLIGLFRSEVDHWLGLHFFSLSLSLVGRVVGSIQVSAFVHRCECRWNSVNATRQCKSKSRKINKHSKCKVRATKKLTIVKLRLTTLLK